MVILQGFRQLEAIDLSYKSYFHSPASMEYLKSNWSKVPHTSLGVDDNVMKENKFLSIRCR